MTRVDIDPPGSVPARRVILLVPVDPRSAGEAPLRLLAPLRRVGKCAVVPSPDRCSSGHPRGDAIALGRPIQLIKSDTFTHVRITCGVSGARSRATAGRRS